ncbi:MAG: glycosyltransferase [Bacteroidetes bacterium]|nr:glycosyltransferase [Bacteroidota bacterium]
MNIVIILLCVVYLARVFIIGVAATKTRKKYNVNINNSYKPFVSVIVPAKDEEKNIENCINSILNVNYPPELYEIIIVNDRSEDNTLNVINKMASKHNNIKICNITQNNSNPNLKGKAGAIKTGIDNAKGEYLLMTDADCIVHPNWINTITKHFIDGKENKENVGMVCSYTNVKCNNIFHYFQAAEWAYMHTYACAGIGLNTVMGCFGNNIAITKEAYNKIGGYETLKFSVTEDFVLLKAIFDAGFSIRYLCMEDSVVETLPENSFKDYMVQRKRWSVGGISLGFKAFIYVASSVALWLAIIFSIFAGSLELLIASCLVRFLGDCLILFPVFNTLNIRYLKKWIPLSVCFYSVIELLLPFIIINKKVHWKGQTFN